MQKVVNKFILEIKFSRLNHAEKIEYVKHVIEDSALLEELSSSLDSDIRLAVAENKYTLLSTLYHLSKDPIVNVRVAVAKNQNFIHSALEKMAAYDPEPEVKNAALTTLKLNTEDYV
jgi:hypothetical protein